MEGKQDLRSLWLRNMLSFGDKSPEVKLGPLNVLIGPNGSGKSNVLEALNLLRALPRDLTASIRDGGIEGWIRGGTSRIIGEIETIWDYMPAQCDLRHVIRLLVEDKRVGVDFEGVAHRNFKDNTVHPHYAYTLASPPEHRGPDLYDFVERSNVPVDRDGFRDDASILAQRWDSKRSPGLSFLENRFKQILLYRNWITGPNAPIRAPQKADQSVDFLREDYANLSLILHNLMNDRETRRKIQDALGRLYDGATDIRSRIVSGYVELHVEEDDGRLIPAARLSDGTLRYLCLLTILCHPNPPPLIGIEEPELGLHPDVIHDIANLLISASQRTQLVVTTHSAALVSALGDVPEAVVVCERGVDGTTLRRLDAERLQKWLEDYTLGDLWTMGEIGGNRW